MSNHPFSNSVPSGEYNPKRTETPPTPTQVGLVVVRTPASTSAVVSPPRGPRVVPCRAGLLRLPQVRRGELPRGRTSEVGVRHRRGPPRGPPPNLFHCNPVHDTSDGRMAVTFPSYVGPSVSRTPGVAHFPLDTWYPGFFRCPLSPHSCLRDLRLGLHPQNTFTQ